MPLPGGGAGWEVVAPVLFALLELRGAGVEDAVLAEEEDDVSLDFLLRFRDLEVLVLV